MSDVLSKLLALPDTDKVALIALCGVIFSALIAYTTSKRSLYINSVTIERSKWIDALRTNIANFSRLAVTLHHKENLNDIDWRSREASQYIEKMNGLISLIKLQLNPNGIYDRNIIILLDSITAYANSHDYRSLIRLDAQLISHSQWLLKAEWEKVKFEAAGVLRKVWILAKIKIHERRYRDFCGSEEGNVLA